MTNPIFSLSRRALLVAGLILLPFCHLFGQPFVPADFGATVHGFQDDFDGDSLGANWTVRGANVFSVSAGLLHISPANGDPNHLLYELPGYDNTTQEVLIRIRVQNFNSGGYPRGGIGVGVDPATSQGINFTFRDGDSEGQAGRHTAFLNDFLAWGPGQNFVWQTDAWYWMRLRQEPNAAGQGGINDVFAKIWLADGSTQEPADWQLTWDYTSSGSTRTGFAGIMAGSEAFTQGGLSEFDVDYVLIKASGLPNVVVANRAFVQVPVAITQPPQSQTVMELFPATFSVAATGNPPPAYQWLKSEAPIPGATNADYGIPITPLSDDGALFKVVAANVVSNLMHSVTSSVARLTVVADTTPPVMLSVQSLGLVQVQIAFSERIAPASATNLAHYVLTGPAGSVTVSNAALDAVQSSVVLDVSPMTENTPYALTVSGLTDQSRAANVIAANSQIGFTAVNFQPYDIANPAQATSIEVTANGYTITAGGRDIGGTADQFHFSFQLRSGDFDMAVRLESLSLSDAWARAGLMARETTNAGSRFASMLATPSMVGAFFLSRASTSGEATPAGSLPINYPYTWLRLQRAGDLFTGYASVDGEHWTQSGAVSLTLSNTLYFGMAVASHSTSQRTTAQFRELAPVTSVTPGPVVRPFEPLAPCSRRTGLVISEIMYHPAPRGDGKNLEFVELFNSQAFDEDLTGYRLSGDIDFTFPPGTVLRAGAFLVVARSPADVQSVYGISGVLGPFTHNLPNDSGTVRLRNEQDSVLLEVNYDSQPPWPLAADGAGHSLVLARPSYGEAESRAWDISDVVGGSPGAMEAFRPSSLRSVFINEILANAGAPPAQDFVELFNYNNQTNDISGCILSDDPDTNKFVIAQGTLVPPRGFIVFTQSQLGFGLKAGGDTIYLKNPDASRVLDALRFDAQAQGVSLGRQPDGAGEFYPLASLTPGSANAPILVSDIVINELMYHPISGNDDDQFLELFNQGTNSVNLSGARFVAGVDFTFPPGTLIASNSYLVIAKNLTNLFAKYANLNPGNSVGNFTGALSRNGERVALAMPQANVTTAASGTLVTNTLYVVVDEVTYANKGRTGRWGRWAGGGGSSLELIDPRSDHRLASNWADSDETAKAPWTTIEHTGLLDLGMPGWGASAFDVLLFDEGECLVDNVEVISVGRNLVANGTFETGANGWLFDGNHETSFLETNGGFNSARSLHLRATGGGDSYANRVRTALTGSIAPGAEATLRAQVRWLRGPPEILLRLRGNWLEATGPLLVPANLGTPGARNSRAVTNASPAIFGVIHSPVLPAANQEAVVTARIRDPDGLSSVQLKYRVDPAATFSTVTMADTGDGIFSAIIPAQPANTLVAFYVEATDGFSPAATARFPSDAPGRECLVRFGEVEPFGGFGTYRLWMTQATLNRWSNRRKTNDEPLDCTFVDGTQRVIYNVGGYFSGSPWKAAFNILDTPTGNMCDYNVRLPVSERLLGATALKLAFPGNVAGDNQGIDQTAQMEPASFWLARQMGLKGIAFRHVNFFVNGLRRGSIIYDAQVPNADLINEVFPDDDNGDLFEGSFWFEADDSDTAGSSYDNSFATMANFTTTGGVKKTARYRWNFPRHGVGGSANDYTRWFALVDALNSRTNYTAAVEELVDVDQWMRVFAYEHLVNNWEAFGFTHGVNMFPYKGREGRWTLIPNDVDISFLGSPSDLFFIDDPVLQHMVDHPPFRRAYWRALQDAASGPLASAPVNALLDPRYAALRANGIAVNSPEGIKSFIAAMRSQVLSQLATVAADFTVNGPATFTTDRSPVTLSGTAPVKIAALTVNGSPWPVTWTSVNNWTLNLPLVAGDHTITIAGRDNKDQPVASANATVTINFTGTNGSPPSFSAIEVSGNDATLRFIGTPGIDYQIEFKDRLDAPAWNPLGPPATMTGSEATVVDHIDTNSHRFYRVVLHPGNL